MSKYESRLFKPNAYFDTIESKRDYCNCSSLTKLSQFSKSRQDLISRSNSRLFDSIEPSLQKESRPYYRPSCYEKKNKRMIVDCSFSKDLPKRLLSRQFSSEKYLGPLKMENKAKLLKIHNQINTLKQSIRKIETEPKQDMIAVKK